MLIPKEIHVTTQPEALEVLVDPISHEKAKLLTVFQRPPLKCKEEEEKNVKTPKVHENPESLQKHVLISLSRLKSGL